MSYLHASSDLLDIPGKMQIDELAFLGALAAQVPAGGRIVEVGAFFGRSTNAMGRANPKAAITSIDTFKEVPWTRAYTRQFREVPRFGRAAFDHFTADLENLQTIEGFSPDAVADWTEPVDMYFEDAIHGNPGLKRNLDFWFDKLRPGGIACGHDYTARFGDIKREVDGWAERWNTEISLVGTLWALRKPCGTQGSPSTLRPALSDAPQVRLVTCNRHAGRRTAPGGYWCGAHLDRDPLKWLTIEVAGAPPGLALEYRLGNARHGETDWTPAGEPVRLVSNGRKRRITRIAVRLADQADRTPYHVVYRVAAPRSRQTGPGGAGPSEWAADGAWAALPEEKTPISSVTVALSRTLPEKPQNRFSRTAMGLLGSVARTIRRRVLQYS